MSVICLPCGLGCGPNVSVRLIFAVENGLALATQRDQHARTIFYQRAWNASTDTKYIIKYKVYSTSIGAVFHPLVFQVQQVI